MAGGIGPESLPQFEDRVLYQVVELMGDGPAPPFTGVSYERVMAQLPDDLAGFSQHDVTTILWDATRTLEREGLVTHEGGIGAGAIRPTLDGRRRVAEWRERWQREQQRLDQTVQRHILEELDHQRRAEPERHQLRARIHVSALCERLGVSSRVYVANARRLCEQGKIGQHDIGQHTLDEGYAFITELGVRALELATQAERPRRDAQEAWVEVARLKRELDLAKRSVPSLIRDPELKRRCEDLLRAEGHYDRVFREACVILEDRVRVAAGLPRSLSGVPVMEQAFSPKGGPLQLSSDPNEQRGAMELFRGVSAFFRNVVGHHVADTYTLDDALRFVAWVDLLLGMVDELSNPSSAAAT